MIKYFEVRTENGYEYGKIINIPEDVSYDTVKERIEFKSDTESVVMVDKKNDYEDIILDWVSIDYENGLDEEILIIDEIIENAYEEGFLDKLIYFALAKMKIDNRMSASECIIESNEELKQK